MALKVGDEVRVINQLFGVYGQCGVVTDISENKRFVTVEVNKKCYKLGEKTTGTYMYYPTDLKKIA